MNLDEFLQSLHFDVDKVRPPDCKVDWEDAPLPYKLYQDLPAIPLSSEVPLSLIGGEAPVQPRLREMGHFLWYGYGLTQCSQPAYALDSTGKGRGPMHRSRRFVPSGGALYPNELYLYLKMEEVPDGIYHYDVAHHRLVLLREGNFDSYLLRALGNRCDWSSCFATVFVSAVFWKNFFKYNYFSYRLQGLDAGALIGQLLELAKRFGFVSGVCFQFLDRAVNHLLGLSEQEESVYAVIPLSLQPVDAWFAGGSDGDGQVRDRELCRELPEIRHRLFIRSRKVKPYPMLVKMNQAAMLETMPSFQRPAGGKRVSGEGPSLTLPEADRLSYDLAAACRKRYSPGMDFFLGKVCQHQLASLLKEATVSFAYRNDLDASQEKARPRISLAGCFYGVEGIPDGAYRYDSEAHALQLLQPGDHRFSLQQGMTLHNVNLFQVPLCLHVTGDRNHLKEALGYRGYRIQQMEAGMLMQRLLLAASALGMGGHPLLGFDVNLSDGLYGMKSRGETCLLQIPVGPVRPHPQLQGNLHA
ncbi:SagB family peptide dehydrogenase [Thermoactinomyces daqus]|uniref:SagB family peptide dehydrogenase n=1 Tax=Thermoactinomyces daqus TaxID=1329516 RepID=A0A7W1XB70_9BACL|nr:SagB family peptide dehydrogenase [Thermoactinomyces daqus]MBA4543467.1 SagB family peptide dehydrogenase [Thermoactinomyces daqus]